MAVMLSYFKPSVMFFHRRMLIRASLFLNFCVLTYVALQAAQNSGTGGGNGAGGGGGAGGISTVYSDNVNLPSGVQIVYNSNNNNNNNNNAETETAVRDAPASTNVLLSSSPSQFSTLEVETEPSSTTSGDQQQLQAGSTLAETTDPPRPSDLGIDCQDRERHFSYSQRGSYWILNHYVPAEKAYHCNESITYTTHGDITFLDNIVPLTKRWDGPLSVAVYTPGSDYEAAIRSMAYLRQCTGPDIRQRVSFHLVLDERHFPTVLRKLHAQQGPPTTRPPLLTVPMAGLSTATPDVHDNKRVVMARSSNGQAVLRVKRSDSRQSSQAKETTAAESNNVEVDTDGLPIVDCDQPAPWSTPPQKTFKQAMNLTYPVNLLRNVARQNAPTHYILASDAELYPSLDMVQLFFDMLRRNESVLHLGRPKVFVLPIFEVYGNQTVPSSKTELVGKLKAGLAVPFHQKVCSYCHSVPKSKEWLVANVTDGLHVFHIAKRHKPYQRWEPIYIGTQDDPLYDERLTWEGKSDKMTQGYALCVLDYDFMILDNAFLVHRPGVKVPRREPLRDAMAKKQSAIIRSAIYRELKVLYGQNSNCVL
ncbi:hypothetical protein GHT06_010828 [Daphnia sinensis]|uniref:N-acetyllactosaminide beta-1,3-N-acetylglucosaminyltransferase n=1 Tax=Daphnia sinensis TaxID=1820382 RepID=A0AAD5KZK7_9CRUS|nr:hypothetical protein GHT06_010828 [Daphnia sinensis]